jgi:ferric-dicitrate binding protein FerR (iron transport regulator)
MNQYEFDNLLEKYLAGICTVAEEKQVLDWYEKQAENPKLLDSSEKKITEKRLWVNIITTMQPRSLIFNRFSWQKLTLAASLLIMLSFSWLFSIKKVENQGVVTQRELPIEGIVVKNTTKNPQKISLEDGSVILLNVGSSITYPEHFGDKHRKVYLKGEAFFEVHKDPTKPFTVYAGNLTAQVLGTSFNIKSHEDSSIIEITVKTGRVSVFENGENSPQNRKGIILTPNQKIIFNKSTKEIIPTLVNEPTPIIPVESIKTLIFEAVPIADVLTNFRTIYGIEIVTENQTLNQCIFTGDLNDLPLAVQLDLICKSINATHEQRGTSIFINGEGCK